MQIKNILESTLKANSRTIGIMDTFASINGQNEAIYDTLAINAIFVVFYKAHRYDVDLLIQRRATQSHHIEYYALTFTSLKTNYRGMHFSEKDVDRSQLLSTLFSSMNESSLLQKASEASVITLAFNTPVEFQAQNSNNLLGTQRKNKKTLYHWNRTMACDSSLGQTTDFVIVGVRLKMLPE
jgi:hypothetical protein